MLTTLLRKNHLQRYIENLITAIVKDLDLDFDVVLDQIQGFRTQLDVIQGLYGRPMPEEAAVWHEEFMTAIDHYHVAFDTLEEYLEEVDDELLKEAYEESDAGDRKLREVMGVLEKENQATLGVMVS